MVVLWSHRFSRARIAHVRSVCALLLLSFDGTTETSGTKRVSTQHHKRLAGPTERGSARLRCDRWDRMEKDMSLTQDQISFTQNMTAQQRHVLRALAYAGPFVMSASERGDPALFALIRMKLAQVGHFRAAGSEFFTWDATTAGKAAATEFIPPAVGLCPEPPGPP